MVRKIFRWIWFGSKLVLVLALLVILGAGIYVGHFFYKSMPDYSGHASLPGAVAPVSVVRDEHGVPHIFASNMNDAARALGYVHASERFFQMEMQRRAGQGRLSEVLGVDMVGTDKYIRTLDLYRLAQSSFDAMSPEAQAFFQAYTDGVNAWLTAHSEQLPPEFTLLKFTPEPWKPADSVVWGKLMAIQLSKNYALEELRAQLAQKISPQMMADLFPGAPADGPVTIAPKGTAPLTQSSLIFDKLGAVTGLDHPASNEWVIAGSRTESGKPILANDPHLGLEAPILWYLARIVTPDLSIEGATVPGLPIFLLGQNGHVAWGFTTTGSDVQDLFIETLDPKNPDRYLTPNGSERFRVHTEIIRVKDGKDVVLEVRSTRHGPVLSDIDNDLVKMASYTNCPTVTQTPGSASHPCTNRLVALSFSGLGAHDTTSEALMRLDRAGNAHEILSALKLYQAPPQNVVYADTEGHIGFINPGVVPIRKAGNGTFPADGASGASDWVSTIPFDGVPQIADPKSGYIFNANNAVVDAHFPYFMGVDWEEPWRAERLQQLFDQSGKQTLESSAAMQADNLSLAAVALLPFMPKTVDAPKDAFQMRENAALDLIKDWNGVMDKDKPEPLIFEAWLYRMHQNLLVARTGSPLTDLGPYEALSIAHILTHDGANWCARPDCSDVVHKSFDEAIMMLSMRDGIDPAGWRWGNEHKAELRNKFWSHVPVLDDWSKLDVASSGDFHTLNRGGSEEIKPADPFARTHGAGYRGIYDLGNPDQSRFMIATGESSHLFSRHYGDLVPFWNNVEGITLSGTHDELLAKGLPELVLDATR